MDHAALATALAEGRLAGAGLDVQQPEPPDLAAPLYNDPRVIVTPHAAFVSVESLQMSALRSQPPSPRRWRAKEVRVSLSIPLLFHVSIEARRRRCTVMTTNRERRRRSPKFQHEKNNRRPCCANGGVSALADNRGRYELDLAG